MHYLFTMTCDSVETVTGYYFIHVLKITCVPSTWSASAILVRFCIPKFGKKIRHAGARSKMHTKIRHVCSEKAHFAENIFRMNFFYL